MKAATFPYEQLELETEGFINPRRGAGLESERIHELAIDIAARGLLYPLLVWSHDGHDAVVGGQRRYLAIGQLLEALEEPCELRNELTDRTPGWEPRVAAFLKDTPCRIVEGDLTTAQATALADGLHREDLSSFDTARAVYELSLKMNQTEIGEALGRDRSFASRHLTAWKKAGPELREKWEAGKIPLNRVLAVAKLPPDEQRALLKSPSGTRGAFKRPKMRTIRLIMESIGAEKPSSGYVRGIRDALRLVLGLIDESEFAQAWHEHKKRQ